MTLFPETTRETPRPASPAPAPAAPRLREANRTQVLLRPVDLESLLPEDHRARIVWAYVEGLDLTPLYQQIDLYGANKRLAWKARSDELIRAYDMAIK